MTGKGILIVENPLVRRLNIFGFVRRFPHKDGIQNDAHTPYINLKRMSPCGPVPVNNLGGDVVGRPAYSFALFVSVFHTSGQAQVPHLYVHIGIEEKVPEFQVAVNHILTMHVTSGFHDLLQEICCFRFGEAFTTFDHFVQTLILAEFKENIAIVLIFKVVFVLANKPMFQIAMDLDLSLQLW